VSDPDPPIARPAPDAGQLHDDLTKFGSDLRAVGESIGAVPPGQTRVISPRTARIVFFGLLAAGGLLSWWAWRHWQSLLFTVGPIVWIFARGRRWQKSRDGRS
jgi:hypothetical protein